MINIIEKLKYHYDHAIFIRSFSLSDQIFFSQRLSLLIDSSIPLVESILIIRNMDNSFHRRRVLDVFIMDINNGISLARSMRNSGVYFNPILITFISNGESSGFLSNSLLQAYKYLEKKNELKKKIISTLIYPLFIVFTTFFMTLFLVLYIFPKILPLLGSLNIKLPLITRIVKNLYEFSILYGLYGILFLILFTIFFTLIIKKNAYLKSILHLFILSIPILGKYFKTYYLSTICNTGEMLLSGGKSIPDMLMFSKDSIRNVLYKNAFDKIHSQSIQGISLSNSLKKHSSLFSIFMIDMCSIGEKTGNVGIMLGHCGRIFEQDLDNFLKRFSSLIEPILMVLMGLIVGSIALSIILPVYEITNHLTK